jgi:hypothetical protein
MGPSGHCGGENTLLLPRLEPRKADGAIPAYWADDLPKQSPRGQWRVQYGNFDFHFMLRMKHGDLPIMTQTFVPPSDNDAF